MTMFYNRDRNSRWQRGRKPPGFACPNPSPRENRKPVPVPINMCGLNFCPSPKPIGFSKPTGNPSPRAVNENNNIWKKNMSILQQQAAAEEPRFRFRCCAGERVLKSEQHYSDRVRGWFVLQGLDAVGLGSSGTMALGHLSQDGSVRAK